MNWNAPLTRGALLLMETLWIYALVAFVVAVIADNAGGDTVSILGVAAIVSISYLISRALEQSELELGLVRIWAVGLSFLLFYAIVRLDFFNDWRLWDFGWADKLFADASAVTSDKPAAVAGIPMLWIFWMRGLARGQQPITFDSIVRNFAFGVVLIAFIQLFAEAADAPDMVGLVTIPYIAIGLLAIGLAQAARAEEYGRSFSGTWVAAVGGAVLLLSGISLIFVLLDLGALANGLGVAGKVLGEALLLLLWPVAWALSQVINGIAAVIQFIFGTGEPFTQEPPASVQPEGEDKISLVKFPGWVLDVARGALFLFFVAIIGAGVALVFRRRRRRQTSNDQAESFYEDGRIATDLSGLLGSLLGRLRPSLHFGDQADPIRRLYTEVLDAGVRRGISRAPGQTPLELAPSLDRAFSAPTPGRITAAFDEARYGSVAVSEDEVQSLRAEWEGLKKENR